MQILRLVLSVGPTSAPYNQFTLPVLDEHKITLCSVFPAKCAVDDRVEYHEGDGSLLHFMGRLWQLLRIRKFDVVHIHSPHLGLMFLLIAILARPAILRRTWLHLHSSYRVYRPRNRWLLLPCFATFARLICCSHSSRQSFPWLFRRLAGRRLVTICNGVDTDRADAQWEYSGSIADAESKPLQLVTAAHLRALKNQAVIIRALAQARSRNVRLMILGDGPMREALRDLSQELGVSERVEFAGCVSREATLRYLWQADGFVSMSRGEGLPVAVLEAMCCHCAVVLSDIPPHREIRGERQDLIPLLASEDIGGLAHAIDAWAGMPVDVRRGWGADCRQQVEKRYSLHRMLAEVDALMKEFDTTVSPEWELLCRCLHKRRSMRKAA